MIVHSSDTPLAFPLGAGFSVDASSEAGSLATARYPLVSDLTKACIGHAELSTGKSIEDLFQEAIDARDKAP
jgi:hypothetical protein